MNPSTITIRDCESHDDCQVCVDLQRSVWSVGEVDLTPAAIFLIAQRTGGQALCAFDGTKPVGFVLAFFARGHFRGNDSNPDPGRPYWHSHMVGVLPEYQNRGVGQALKLRQREEALRRGISTIEWTFDPLQLRNAHFNIARLGAIVRRYIPNCYPETASPLHAGLPADRIVAEWRLPTPSLSAAVTMEGQVEVPIASNIGELRIANPIAAREIQAALRQRLTELLGSGYSITGFRKGTVTCHYLLCVLPEPHGT